MKKTILFIIVIIMLLPSCASSEVKYKRIVLQSQNLGGSQGNFESILVRKTIVNNQSTEVYSEKMPVYKIAPLDLTSQDLVDFAGCFNINETVQYNDEGMPYIKIEMESDDSITGLENVALVSMTTDNGIDYFAASQFDCGEMKQTDIELAEEAKKVFSSIPLTGDDYEFIGLTSTRTVSSTDGEYIVEKGFSFQPVIDGTRVIGEDYCVIYFNANGLSGVSIRMFSYEKIGEIDILPIDDAIKRVKKADAFTLYDTKFTGEAESLSIERTKLLYVNQFSDGCEILEPVYNLMGTVTNDNGSSDFSAKVIAIPEKYTYN